MALMVALLAGGCATQHDLWPVERLDPYSAVNTTIMAEPWVYSHDVPAIAANARDYLNVGVVETNRAGLRAYWLGIVAWSTIDRSALGIQSPREKPGKMQLNWPDASLELEPVAAGRKALGASEPIFAGPQPVYQEAWYLLSVAQLARLARDPPASVSVISSDDRTVVYQTWRVERAAMDRFVEATGVSPRTR
jgi:hypothetical protein